VGVLKFKPGAYRNGKGQERKLWAVFPKGIPVGQRVGQHYHRRRCVVYEGLGSATRSMLGPACVEFIPGFDGDPFRLRPCSYPAWVDWLGKDGVRVEDP
jgi:hypothetical protein